MRTIRRTMFFALLPSLLTVRTTIAFGADTKVSTEQAATVSAFEQIRKAQPQLVDHKLRLQGLTLKDADQQLKDAGKKPLLEATMESFQQVIETSFRPLPILNGTLITVIPPLVSPLNPDPTAAELAGIRRLATSVGRVERIGDPLAHPIGTAFVVGDNGLMATNCHVIQEITIDRAGKTLDNPASLRIDFAEGPRHDQSLEFEVTEVAGCPTRLAFDVGFLRVKTLSYVGSHPLPPKLIMTAQPVQKDWGKVQARVALIGYPNLFVTTDPMYAQLHADQYAKVVTFGIASGLEPAEKDTFNFVLHISSSSTGNSGSPLIDLSSDRFLVLGVHNCCADAFVPNSDKFQQFPCSYVAGRHHQNKAIASWDIPNDHVLGGLLAQP